MSSLDEIYGSGGGAFLKAKDLLELEGNASRPVLFIKSVDIQEKTFREEEGPKKQIVLSFFTSGEGISAKKLGLNKTQAQAISVLYGSDFDQWNFKGIRIYPGKTSFQGETKDTIAIYPDPFEMTPEQLQKAKAVLAEEASMVTSNAPTGFSGPASRADVEPAFGPSSYAAPGLSADDPTKDW